MRFEAIERIRMPVLEIHTLPSPVLRQKAVAVDSVSEQVRTLMDNMLETMYAGKGIGLAANQVGVLKRVIVMDIAANGDEASPLLMANPEIIEHSSDLNVHEEGCLSVPGQYAKIQRPRFVSVRYLDREGEVRHLSTDGLLSTCIQHEIDHLNGIVFVDKLSAVKRAMIVRKLKKTARQKLL